MLELEVDIRRLKFKTYDELYNAFRWKVPEYFNIGEVICDRPAQKKGDNPAIFYEDSSGKIKSLTYRELLSKSNQFSNFLRELNIRRGSKVAICTSQKLESVIALISIYKLGCIAVSISPLYNISEVLYRVKHSEAEAIITEGKFKDIIKNLYQIKKLKNIILVEGETKSDKEVLFEEYKDSSRHFESIKVKSNEPAHIFYTSGTTGPPKGILHAHRFLLGLIPGYQLYFELAPKINDIYWTPVDWGWLGSIGVVVLPTLYFGMPIAIYSKNGTLGPEEVLDVLERYKVTCTFLPPSIIRLIKKTVRKPREKYNLRLRTIVSAGELVSYDIIKWVKDELKASISVLYGCSEAVLLTFMSEKMGVYKEGSLGKAIAGHNVSVIDEDGNILPPGKIGYIAVKYPDPVVFLGYWRDPKSTSKKFIDNWFLTGDLGYIDEDGYIWYKSRVEDLIQMEMLKLGPEEIESLINQIPEVLESAVVSYTDEKLGNMLVAFIVLKSEIKPDEALKDKITSKVISVIRDKITIKDYAIQVEFIDKLPKTVTGKIKRYVLRESLRK